MELIHDLLKYHLVSSYLHKILLTDLKAFLDNKSPLLVPSLFLSFWTVLDPLYLWHFLTYVAQPFRYLSFLHF